MTCITWTLITTKPFWTLSVFHDGNDTFILQNVILNVKYYVNIMSYRKVLINNIISRKKTCNEYTCNINISRSYSLGKKAIQMTNNNIALALYILENYCSKLIISLLCNFTCQIPYLKMYDWLAGWMTDWLTDWLTN